MTLLWLSLVGSQHFIDFEIPVFYIVIMMYGFGLHRRLKRHNNVINIISLDHNKKYRNILCHWQWCALKMNSYHRINLVNNRSLEYIRVVQYQWWMIWCGVTTQSRDVVYIAICISTLRPKQYGRHFADDIFRCIFMNENIWFPIKMSLKFVPKGLINNIPALVEIMAWRRSGDKPLSEPMMVRLDYRRIYASLGLNELRVYPMK